MKEYDSIQSTELLFASLVRYIVVEHARIEELTEELKDLSMIEKKTLLLIGSRQKITVGEIGNSLKTAPSTTTWIIGQLIKKGMLTREKSLKDKRKVFVEISNVGKKIYQQLDLVNLKVAKQILRGLPIEYRNTAEELAQMLLDISAVRERTI